jgi:hypothetical protein
MEISGSYRADTVLGEERGALDDSASYTKAVKF